jgi:hypothetical protein
MYGKKVPLELWGLAVLCAVYVQNRVISSTGKVTPFQLWYGKEPDVSHLRTFGSTAFSHVPDEKRRKLDPKATEGIMVGYGDSYRVYKIWDPVDRKIITSRDVVFDEKCSFDHSSELEEMDYFSLFPIPTDDPLVNYFFFVISLGMPITNSLIIFSILANTYSGADPLEPT